jgi:hypothetical protein
VRVEQSVAEPCGLCMLILQSTELSEFEKGVYERHLRLHHRLQPYHIDR